MGTGLYAIYGVVEIIYNRAHGPPPAPEPVTTAFQNDGDAAGADEAPVKGAGKKDAAK
jgi:hypothetical protein